jgi:glutathione peroxidase
MTIYDYKVQDAKHNEVAMDFYKGKVLLIVNTATGCGFTPQYDGLQKLYEKYQAQGFEILDFPCNQFLGQAPGTNDEIVSFCQLRFGTTFQTFSKIDVNGKNAEPLYAFLKKAAAEDTENNDTGSFVQKLKSLGQSVVGTDIKWNFTKFLIDQDGNVVARYAPNIKPSDIDPKIAKLLK